MAKVKNCLEAELKKIERCQLLILDDLFLVQLDAKERPILLDIIEDRHERKSIIITSQYPSSSWYDMVGDPTVADAILDRDSPLSALNRAYRRKHAQTQGEKGLKQQLR